MIWGIFALLVLFAMAIAVFCVGAVVILRWLTFKPSVAAGTRSPTCGRSVQGATESNIYGESLA